jgi:ribosomal protein L3 glutamine methyltransferase
MQLVVETREITDHLKTPRDYIRWASSEFYRNQLTFGHGFGKPLDEAVYLVLHALSLPWDWPETYFDTRLTERERQRVVAIISRRIKSREPAAYISHEAFFCGLPFYVDERVLVPRSPIAELIEQSFEPWLDPANVYRVLDLCTGSACIAIACQHALPHAEVAASDLSLDALEVAKINRGRHAMDDTLTLYHSDLFDDIPQQQFDLIVSNPPYVDRRDMDSLSEEHRYEPHIGLAAGDDGLLLVARILRQAPDYLSDDGLLVVEVGNSQAALVDRFPQLPLTWIEFEHGGAGVFCIHAAELRAAAELLDQSE